MSDENFNYRTGYKKPPKNRQFKKGQSGNPNGRPKGSKNISCLYKDLLEEKISIKEGGKQKNMTVQEAIARRVRADALQGKDKAIDRILEHAPQNKDEETRYTEAEWVETLNIDALNLEEIDILIKLFNSEKK